MKLIAGFADGSFALPESPQWQAHQPFQQTVASHGDWTQMNKRARTVFAVCLLCSFAVWPFAAQDVPNSKDPGGMKR